MLEQDPAYVVRRFESGKYAIDSDIRSIYLEVIVLNSFYFYYLCFWQAVDILNVVSVCV